VRRCKASKPAADLSADGLCVDDLSAGIICEASVKSDLTQANGSASRRVILGNARRSPALPQTALAAALLKALARRAVSR